LRQALILLQFEHCQPGKIHLSVCPGSASAVAGPSHSPGGSCRAARSAGRPCELRGERTGIPISPSGSDRNWNHFDVWSHLVPILPFISACNWNHFGFMLHLVPIHASSGHQNWNHSDDTRRLVPISSFIPVCNWNHFGERAHLVPIPLFRIRTDRIP